MEIPSLTSRQNPLVRQAAALGSDAAARRENGAFLCEGARLCRDAVRSSLTVETCFFTDRAMERYPDYLREILPAAKAAYRVNASVAALLSATRNSQEIFCVCRAPAPGRLDHGPCLVLENLQDPGNLGTVLRTAEAFGVGRVLLAGDCCDPLSPKALRAGMGAVFRLSLEAYRDSAACWEALTAQGYQQFASVPDAAAAPVTEIDFTAGSCAVWVGNEGSGLTPEVQARCRRVTIPMAGRAESLNASAAATVLLWELTRKGAAPHG